MIYEIKCRFCGKKDGAFDLPDKIWAGRTPTNELLGIEDHRCDSCGTAFGNYKDMQTEYKRDIKGSYDDFNTLMRASDYKRSKFDTLVSDIKEKKRDERGTLKPNKL